MSGQAACACDTWICPHNEEKIKHLPGVVNGIAFLKKRIEEMRQNWQEAEVLGATKIAEIASLRSKIEGLEKEKEKYREGLRATVDMLSEFCACIKTGDFDDDLKREHLDTWGCEMETCRMIGDVAPKVLAKLRSILSSSPQDGGKPDWYYGITWKYTPGVDPEVHCSNCGKTFLCDPMDATCRMCDAPYDASRDEEFGFKRVAKEKPNG